jgi:hypothetical protein
MLHGRTKLGNNTSGRTNLSYVPKYFRKGKVRGEQKRGRKRY